jgi:hypothetical protein
MKKPTHTAIFTSLALSLWAGLALAGWHTNAPFVAWPATNHLRWVDNVGVYTQSSVWGWSHGTNTAATNNPAYGQWTNNYIGGGLYVKKRTIITPGYAFPWPTPWEPPYDAPATQVTFNAKDVRLLDVLKATAERMVAGTPGVTTNNLYLYLMFLPNGDSYFEQFFRNERLTVHVTKAALRTYLIPYYYRFDGTNYTKWDETNLCAAAGVPTNFLRQTFMRGMDSTATAYARIITNTWTMGIYTNDSNAVVYLAEGTVTNTFIDSFSGEHVFAGTNGQAFTAIVTNTALAESASFLDYGIDGLKACITNLRYTALSSGWTNGSISPNRVTTASDTNNTDNWVFDQDVPTDGVLPSSNAQVEAATAMITQTWEADTAQGAPYEVTQYRFIPRLPDPGLYYRYIAQGQQSVMRSFQFATMPVTSTTATVHFEAQVVEYGGDQYQNDGTYTNYSYPSIPWGTVLHYSTLQATNGLPIVTATNCMPATIASYLYPFGYGLFYTAEVNQWKRLGWQAIEPKAWAEWHFEYH